MSYYPIKEITPKIPAEGVEMRVVHGERMTIAFFRIGKGSRIPEHAHPHEQIGTVISGRMEITIAGEKHNVAAGGAYHIPSSASHSGLCLDGPAEVIEMFAPVREDWR